MSTFMIVMLCIVFVVIGIVLYGLLPLSTTNLMRKLMTTSEDKPPYVWPGKGPKEIIYEVWGSGGILYETASEAVAQAIIKHFNTLECLKFKYWDFIPLKGFGKSLMLGSRAK